MNKAGSARCAAPPKEASPARATRCRARWCQVMGDGIRDGVHTAGDLQLAQYVADMKFHGRAADNQPFGNGAVVESIDHQRQYITFLWRQSRAGLGKLGLACLADQQLGCFQGEGRAPGVGGVNGFGSFIGCDILEKIAQRTRFQHPFD